MKSTFFIFLAAREQKNKKENDKRKRIVRGKPNQFFKQEKILIFFILFTFSSSLSLF